VYGNKPSKNVGKFKKGKKNKNKKNKFKDQSSGKGKKSFTCHHCGGPNHIAKKCNIPQHLIDLYQMSKWFYDTSTDTAIRAAHCSSLLKRA
jgi:hypothetical protein